MTNLGKALLELHPDAFFILHDDEYDGLDWRDENIEKPSREVCEAKVQELIEAEPLRLLRVERDKRLSQTDWWAVADRTMTEAQTAYRQALRDITQHYQSLDEVVWPEKP